MCQPNGSDVYREKLDEKEKRRGGKVAITCVG